MSIVLLILACFLIIVAVILTSIMIIISQQRTKCLGYKSPWCYTDWQCGGSDTGAPGITTVAGVALPPVGTQAYPVIQTVANTLGFFAYPQMLAGIKQCEVTDYYILADTRVGTWSEANQYITITNTDGSIITANNVTPSASRTVGTTTAQDINYPGTTAATSSRATYYFTANPEDPVSTDVFMIVRDLIEVPQYTGTAIDKSATITLTYGPQGQTGSGTPLGYMEPLTVPAPIAPATATYSTDAGRNPGFAVTNAATVGTTVGTATVPPVPKFVKLLPNLPIFRYVNAWIPTTPATTAPPTAYIPTNAKVTTAAGVSSVTSACSTAGTGAGCFFSYNFNSAVPAVAADPSDWKQASDPEGLLAEFTYTRGPNYTITAVTTTPTPYDPLHLSYSWAIDKSHPSPDDTKLALPNMALPASATNIPSPQWYFNRKGIALFLTATTNAASQQIYRPVMETTRYTDNTEFNSCYQIAPDWTEQPIPA
jgi:hypothetical protein